MSLILFEGFEDLGAWNIVGSSTVAAGRNGNAASFPTGTGSNVFRQCLASEEHATFVAGCAFKYTTMPSTTFSSVLLGFYSDGGTTAHTWLTVEPDGTMKVSRSGTNLLSSAVGIIAINTWYYVEFKATLGDSAAAFSVRLNGTVVITGSGDTKNAGTKTVYDTLRTGGITTNPGALLVDDLYWLNGAGSTSNDFLGDLAVETLYPNGMDTTAWTGSDADAVDNHLLVDEAGTPSMTDYVQSSTVSARELYTLGNLARTSGTVHGVTVASYANKSDSGLRGLKLAIKESGGAQRQSADNALTTTPTTYVTSWDRKNDTTAWSVSDINGLAAGVEVGS